MAKTRKPKYKARTFESRGEHFVDDNGTRRADTSANIYESMLLSKAWQDLNCKQRNLYLCCKAQYYGKRKPGKDYGGIEAFQSNEFFYLNFNAISETYQLYKPSMAADFYRDIKILINHGFIKKYSAKTEYQTDTRAGKKNIYEYSSEWQEWGKDKN